MVPFVVERREPPGLVVKEFTESPDGSRRAATSGSLHLQTLSGPVDCRPQVESKGQLAVNCRHTVCHPLPKSSRCQPMLPPNCGFTIVAAVAQLEKDIIRERVQAEVARARKHRASWGRPKRWTDAQLAKARELRASGKSWREVAMAVGLKVRTIRRALSQAAAVAKALPNGASP